jgi:DtxR family Mn-dependent transcriptional regulator
MTHTKENYLKAIYHLEQNREKISLSDLGKKMEVSMPTVNSMVKSLQEKKWVIYKKYQPLKLTDKGRVEAALIIRKHRLTEMFLAQFMDFGWEEVHEIAEEIEHLKVDKFFDRMDELLGFPSIDPHGSPIPDKNGVVIQRDYEPLSAIEVGPIVRVCSLCKSSKDLLLYLNRKQISLGTELEVLKREPFDNSILVSYKGNAEIMLSQEVAQLLLVERC